MIAKKLEQVMSHGLNAMICVGEKVEEKDEGKTEDVIDKQLSAIKGINVAYIR